MSRIFYVMMGCRNAGLGAKGINRPQPIKLCQIFDFVKWTNETKIIATAVAVPHDGHTGNYALPLFN
jgi:hypothetical protein